MNKFQAVQTYWSSFGLPAYNELTVPSDAQMPYFTYESGVGSLNGPMVLSGSLWYRGTSWAPIMQKVIEIEPYADQSIPYEGGALKIRKPEEKWAQPMSEPSDDKIRRIVFTIEAEFLSA